jgi:hypothetical protein
LAEELKTNSMERKAKGSGFKMKKDSPAKFSISRTMGNILNSPVGRWTTPGFINRAAKWGINKVQEYRHKKAVSDRGGR